MDHALILVWALAAVLLFAEALGIGLMGDRNGEGVSVAATVAYGLFCVICGATVLAVSGRFDLRRAIPQGLGVCLFGLATAWSWLFLAPAGAPADVVRSALDLVLALAVVAAFCNHGWPVEPRFAMLAGGFGLFAVADSMQAQGDLTAVSGLDIADALLFAGAALV
ncbi:MAG: hypothetical protein ACTHNY_01080, partial [Solirubrobacterales bacterium]